MNYTHVSYEYSSINDVYKQTSGEIICRWDISIVRDCKGSIYFLWIYYICIVLYSAMIIFSLALLIYKIFFTETKLWSDRMIDPMNGYLIYLCLHGICEYL